MAKGQRRKAIPKSVRFEVFKRDKFTCQYCGESAPNVILEIDHIVPVSKGGGNDIMNLVTACRDCNSGKTNKRLDDNSAIMVQKNQLDIMQERREQLEMMIQWRASLDKELDIEADAINVYIKNNTKWEMDEEGIQATKRHIKRFGFNEVYTAWEIAISQYYNGSSYSWDKCYRMVGGICYNRRKAAEQDAQSNIEREHPNEQGNKCTE